VAGASFVAFAPVCWLNNGLLINLLAALLQCCTIKTKFMESATTALAAETEIRELIDDKMAAIYNRDEHAVLNRYAANVITYDLAPPLQNNGGLKDRLQKWFSGYTGHINQEAAHVEVAAGSDIAYSHCLMRTWGTSVLGEEQDMWYRVTTCYKNERGKWLIVHEHLSEPIDMENGKALFNQKP
jgi:ketosteroid isomerase-like protein